MSRKILQPESIEKAANVTSKIKEYIPVFFILLFIIFADPSAFSATFGLLLVILGELIRIHTIAYLAGINEKDSEDQQPFFESGPYKYVRALLYVGNILIAAGLGIFCGLFWLALFVTAAILVQYYLLHTIDEKELIEKYGDKYNDYIKKTPTCIPYKAPSKSDIFTPLQYGEAVEQEIRTLTSLGVVLLLILIFG
jgi:protein-S-isoprenylcysteine O-methyltransferase Ste14